MFDLELEWTVGVGWGKGEKTFPTPALSLFLTVDRPLQFVKLRKANLDASYQKVEWSCKN